VVNQFRFIHLNPLDEVGRRLGLDPLF
jgi:hypothetical protein